MGEATDREPIAIAMFESWARTKLAEIARTSPAAMTLEMIKHKPGASPANSLAAAYGEASKDWYSQMPEVRDMWRNRAAEMIREAR